MFSALRLNPFTKVSVGKSFFDSEIIRQWHLLFWDDTTYDIGFRGIEVNNMARYKIVIGQIYFTSQFKVPDEKARARLIKEVACERGCNYIGDD